MAPAGSAKLKTSRRFRFAELRQKLVLTPREKRVVIFIIAAFLLGLGTKYYRDTHPLPVPPAKKSSAVKPQPKNQSTPARARD